ncbi:LLM class F420-dependent oxidoreductase [Microlunatus speluncae]|uniref:LLM class F420-dependent oxidoreductase n=1 Tax=Microlunatus speluncae TaxID=2594267 RepID=UPI0012665263|nr:LLM class F420-dependent oxidoreductase [Microlunatus speluncae]
MVTTKNGVGVWQRSDLVEPELARSLEELGYRSIWLGLSPGDLIKVEELLAATERIVVGTGIVNMWADEAEPVAAAYHRVVGRYPGRFVLGVGIGHPEATKEYRSPYATIVDYLDRLDAAGVPREDVVLAALGPKVLRLAAERTAGPHPYLVTPEHTRRSRELIGAGPFIATEQKVVLDPDPVTARQLGRDRVGFYLELRNYLSNLRTLGFTDDDFAAGGSDRLIDALAPHGDAATVAAALTAHLDAGADQVVLQLLSRDGDDPVPGYKAIAVALGLDG